MALLHKSQDAIIIISAFLLPIITYLLYTRTAQAKSSSTPPPPTEITNLFIYPIKSCHGISVPSARLLPTGLDLDRQWMWVSGPRHEFLTIRNNARMTLIRPFYNPSTDTLTVIAPNPNPNSRDDQLRFCIPAHPTPDWLAENTTIVSVQIWSTATPAHAYATSLTSAFDAFFGKQVRLVYKSPVSEVPRLLGSNGQKAYLGREASTCFPDLMPVLVGCEASIDELNQRLVRAEGLEIDVMRFRPNILVRGGEAWEEDRWKTVRITGTGRRSSEMFLSFWKGWKGGLVLDVTQRCARCRVPNVDPETAEEHKRQPWDTLMKYRRVDEGINYKPCFGMLCVPRGKGGNVDVGMSLEITEVTDKHRYVVGF